MIEYLILHPGVAFAPLLLALLFGGHAVADYGLQSAYVAEFKVRPKPASRLARIAEAWRLANREGDPKPGGNADWFVTLGAHCLIHAFLVAVVSMAYLACKGAPMAAAAFIAGVLAWAEFALHFAIDDAKGQERFSYRVDQALHYGCKLVWFAVLLAAA